jgi:hypothetical protein
LLQVLLQDFPNFPFWWHLCKVFVSTGMQLFKTIPKLGIYSGERSYRRVSFKDKYVYLPSCYGEILNTIQVLWGK